MNTESIPKKKLLIGLVIPALLLAAFLIYYWFILLEQRISTDDAYIEADLIPVNARILGYVKEVPKSETHSVKKGDVLAILDDTDIKVELAFKEAKYKKSIGDFDRAKSLRSSRAISSSDFELAQANWVANKADYEGSQLKLSYTQILSPVDGTIAKKNVQPGQFVQPGQSLFVIVPDGAVWIKANYKETQVGKIKAGMNVKIEVDSFPGKKWQGKVESLYPSSGAILALLPPENATGNFTKIVQRIPVKISISGPNSPELKPGMSVTTTIYHE